MHSKYKQDLLKKMLAQGPKKVDRIPRNQPNNQSKNQSKNQPKAPAKDHDISLSASSDDEETTPSHVGEGGDKTAENVSEPEEGMSVDSDGNDNKDDQEGGQFITENDDEPEPVMNIGSSLIANFNKQHEHTDELCICNPAGVQYKGHYFNHFCLYVSN